MFLGRMRILKARQETVYMTVMHDLIEMGVLSQAAYDKLTNRKASDTTVTKKEVDFPSTYAKDPYAEED